MKWIKVVFVLALFNSVFSQDSLTTRLAILPFEYEGIDSIYMNTTQSILKLEINRQSSIEIIDNELVNNVLNEIDCSGSDCDKQLSANLDARILKCSIAPLGEKIIIQYYLYDGIKQKKILIDQLTANQIEEMETVMKRIAKSIIELKPGSANPEVGTILEAESKESLRRSSRNNLGVSFGYLYPMEGYDNDDRTFVFDVHVDHELEKYAVGLELSIRSGFAMNIYGNALLSNSDFCPYVGAGFGFHWVSHNKYGGYYDYQTNMYVNPDQNKKSDGFELIGNAGLRIFHTYSFQIVTNLALIYTLNDYDDVAIVFTIGIL